MGEVKVVHLLAFYGAPLGITPVPRIHYPTYCLVDDLLSGNQVPHLVLPDSALEITADLRVPTLATLNNNVNPIPEHFGPYNNNGADSELVRTRPLCWVPPFIASRVMASADRSPLAVANIIGSAVAGIPSDGHISTVFLLGFEPCSPGMHKGCHAWLYLTSSRRR